MSASTTLLTFASLQNDTSATSDLNTNFSAINTALTSCLSTAGQAPNQMQSNLDMNSFRILNLPTPVNVNEPLRVADAGTLTAGGSIVVSPLPVGGATGAFLVKNSAANFDVAWTSILVIPGSQGGTGVNNSGKTITLGGNILTANSFTTVGNFSLAFTTTANTSLTLPKSGTLISYDANNNVFGGTNALGNLSSGTFNCCIGSNAGRVLTSGSENVIIGGQNGGFAITTGLQNVFVGSQAGESVTGDTGHTLVGYQAGLTLNGNAQTWCTFIGHAAGRDATTAGGCVAIGRAAGIGFLTDTDCLAIGHAAVFDHTTGGVSSQSTALGNQAAGALQTGSANWQGTGLTYFGMINDNNVNYIGDSTGKASAVGRTNCFALGSKARIPINDNVGWIGKSLTAVGTAARLWEGYTSTTVNSAVGVTLTATQVATGEIIRTGAPGAGFSDTTPTAAQLVAIGPGNSCEVPVSTVFNYFNNGTGQTATLVGGTNVTVTGTATVANNIFSSWRVIITNSTSGAEAVTLLRTG